ncbi:hypothetical protein SEA_SATIS_21 [Streptomyces phage Satis]|nr:hypothetical protein SEA_SATIS_21 [Streptomyces phage Satis]QBZ71920.1 hypothetical protein SEA_KRADAL_21 [Streptomyces phage Kradal]
MYPKPCGVCQGRVPAGEGIVQGSHASGWTVTHDACPRGSVRHGHAQAYARRVVSVLRRKSVTADDLTESLNGLAALVRTGWTSRESCEKIILSAEAFQDMDRLAVEDILAERLSQVGSRC